MPVDLTLVETTNPDLTLTTLEVILVSASTPGPAGVAGPAGADGPAGGLLVVTSYNPGTGVTASNPGTSFVDIDATNMKVTFTAPPSGAVLVKMEAGIIPPGDFDYYWGLRDSGGDVAGSDVHVIYGLTAGPSGTDIRLAGSVVMTGLTPAASYTWKWAHKASGGTDAGIQYGVFTAGGRPANLEVHAVPS